MLLSNDLRMNSVIQFMPAPRTSPSYDDDLSQSHRCVRAPRVFPWTSRSERFLGQCSESSHKISSIRLVIDNPPLFNASNHHVVQGPCPWTIESCLPRHPFLLLKILSLYPS